MVGYAEFNIGARIRATRWLIVLSQKVARSDFENQLFEKIQDWRARC